MRSSPPPIIALFLILSPLLLGPISCASMGWAARAGGDDLAYDGTTESMDSLPDCIPEMTGSSFWVKEKGGAFDCTSSGEWKNRRSARVPDDVDDEEPAGAWTPRLIEK
ncbi:MAG: hypothetical protein H7249_15000 [Chitinophagaceae bacterium]|nr:hypothetical protein [Oligoflexus sp.]